MTCISRRTALGFAATVGFAGLAGKASADENSERLLRFMRMRGALDGRLCIGFVSGRYQGLVEGRLKPLFGVTAATFTRYRRDAAGFKGIYCEQAYFTDLETGRALETWLNPYTGEQCQVPIAASQPVKFSIEPAIEIRNAEPLPPSIQFSQTVSGPQIIGDDITFIEEIVASRRQAGADSKLIYSDITILRSRRRDLIQPGDQPVSCETSYQAVVEWRPWMKMGTLAGQLICFGAGRYGATLQRLPSNWLDATRRWRPDLLASPSPVLEALQPV